MSEMLKILIEQNKAIMKTQSDRNKISGPSNLAMRPAEIRQEIWKIKVTKFKMILIWPPSWPPLVVVGLMKALVPKAIMQVY